MAPSEEPQLQQHHTDPEPLLRLTEAHLSTASPSVRLSQSRLVAVAMVLPAVIATMLLLIPLGGFASPGSDTMDPVAYIVFQLLYITPAGILVSLYYREGMPGFGAVMRTVITVLLIVCCGLFLAYIPVHSMRFGLGKTFNYKTLVTNAMSYGLTIMYMFYAISLDCFGHRSRYHMPAAAGPSSKGGALKEVQEEGVLDFDDCCNFDCLRGLRRRPDNEMTAPMLDGQASEQHRTPSVVDKVLAMVPLTSALDFSPYYAEPTARLEQEYFWGSALRMWVRLTITWAGMSGIYTYCQAYIDLASHESFQVMPLYLTFTVGLHVLRSLATWAARNCDKYRQSSVSIEVVIDMTGWCFYYLFYRNLFGLIETWRSFVVVEVLTILNELVVYLVRLSDRFETFHDQQMKDQTWKGQLYRLLSYEVKTELLLQRVCLDYAMRFSLLTTTGLAFMLYFTFIRFDYNENFYQRAKDIPYEHTMLFLGLGLVVELLLFFIIRAFAIQQLRRRGLQPSLMGSWSSMVYIQPVYLIYFMVIVTHIITDTYISNMDISTLLDRDSSITDNS